MNHLSRSELDAALPWLLGSPSKVGRIELIVRRPAVNEREVLAEAVLDLAVGLVGDNWLVRGNNRTADHGADPDAQITVINARLASLVAGYGHSGADRLADARPGRAADAGGDAPEIGAILRDAPPDQADPSGADPPGAAGLARDRRTLAGDQLYLDFDLSEANLPVGSRLRVGSAVLEVSAMPHTGCGKFARRFGPHALQFVNSPTGLQLRLRGLNARLVAGGRVRVGDAVTKVEIAERAVS